MGLFTGSQTNVPQPSGKNEAWVLIIRNKNRADRFFYDYGKKDRVLSAWSLAGARLFASFKEADEMQDELIAKGKNCYLAAVGLGL